MKVNRRLPLIEWAFAGVLGLAAIWSTAIAQEAVPIQQISSEVCETCHQEIYKQWKGSMHAQSTALSDPIHATFYKKVVGDPTQEGVLHKASGKFPVCLQCHAPNAARDKTTKLDAMPAYAEGVNCVACHTLQHYKGIEDEKGKIRYGVSAYELADTLQGPMGFPRGLQKLKASDDLFGGAAESSDDQKPNPHLGESVEMDGKSIPALTMEANPIQLRTSDACMGCHDQRDNPQGVPLCQTGNEFIKGGSKVACQTCHMPVAAGYADHTMGGGHHDAMLKRSVVFDLQSEPVGESIKTLVHIRNLQPHAMPTGAPFRNLYLKLTAYDSSGEVVWENADGHPAKSDPQAYFAYGLIDDKGLPAPPPTATKPGEDTRLEAHEIRELSYEIPAKDVALIRAELYYNLLWPSLVKKFDHLSQDLTDPVLIAVAEREIATD
ncbi:cytochrome c family protein [Thiorhodococcus mannitoliphagus]|uniref:Cytochrome c family protein n=1 Tax=Thiorhodococcus mannitoliphagus TaxID=329406 RepID=A0A6P1DYQ5_9GAMM|nr:cytochrome c family protein [Thiorhodococcus mannitoliphagus]NEX22213.1 cytochrome c family protein [Thiorhodococcus mannitoliphagus]